MQCPECLLNMWFGVGSHRPHGHTAQNNTAPLRPSRITWKPRAPDLADVFSPPGSTPQLPGTAVREEVLCLLHLDAVTHWDAVSSALCPLNPNSSMESAKQAHPRIPQLPGNFGCNTCHVSEPRATCDVRRTTCRPSRPET